MASLKARVSEKTEEVQSARRETTQLEKSKAHLELSLRSLNQRFEQLNRSYEGAIQQVKEQKRTSSSPADHRGGLGLGHVTVLFLSRDHILHVLDSVT